MVARLQLVIDAKLMFNENTIKGPRVQILCPITVQMKGVDEIQ